MGSTEAKVPKVTGWFTDDSDATAEVEARRINPNDFKQLVIDIFGIGKTGYLGIPLDEKLRGRALVDVFFEDHERALGLAMGLDVAIDHLDENISYPLRLYYGLDGKHLTLDEIGMILKKPVTGARVGQIKERGVRQLRHPSRSKYYSEFMPEGIKS